MKTTPSSGLTKFRSTPITLPLFPTYFLATWDHPPGAHPMSITISPRLKNIVFLIDLNYFVSRSASITLNSG